MKVMITLQVLLAAVISLQIKGWDLTDLLKSVGGQIQDDDEVASGRHPNVKALSQEDFESFVSTPEKVSAVMFISPWCFVCGPLLPLWGDAARMVVSGGVQFGVIDVMRNPSISESNNIRAFPTIKIFVDNEVFTFTHDSTQTPLSASVFVNWVNNHTKRRNVISSESQLKDFLKENHLVVAALLNDQEPESKKVQDQLAHSSLHFEDVFFIEISSSEIKQKFFDLIGQPPIQTSGPSIVMVYDHDDKYAKYSGPFTQDGIDAFIKGRRLLTVNVFQPGTIEYILDAGLPMLFLITSDLKADAIAVVKAVASQYLGQIVAVTLGKSQPWEQKLTELLDVQDEATPLVRILAQRPSEHHDHDPVSQSNSIIKHGIKYKPSDSDNSVFEEKFVKNFVQQFLAGTLAPYVRSEPEPEDPKDSFTPGSILVNAVAANFPRLVVDDTKRDVLVVFHAPWCGFCRKLMPTLRELGEKLGHNGKALKLVKIDATRNEVPNVSISGYPTIVLFNSVPERVELDRRPSVRYEGDRSVEDLIQFLHANAINQFSEVKPNDGASTTNDNSSYSFEEL